MNELKAPCGSPAHIDYDRGPSLVCDTCFCVVGSIGMPSACRPTRGRVERVPNVTKAMMRDEPRTLFVFGDNMARTGRGGQAWTMRDEPNAIGVPTKWRPGSNERDYFTDADIKNPEVWSAIHQAFERLRAALKAGSIVVIPTAGLGTGFAQLPTRAPRLYAMIEAAIASLENLDA